MTDILTAFALAAMSSLAPQRPHDVLAKAVVDRVDAEAALFADDPDKKKTAALMVAILFREGSLGLRVEGDRVNGVPTSWCTAQINMSAGGKTREGWSGPDLRDDPAKCVAVSMRLLRDSIRWCPAFPVAIYASGPRGCSSPHAQRISRDREALAAKLVRDVAATTAVTGSLFLPSNTAHPARAVVSRGNAPQLLAVLPRRREAA